MYSMLKAVSFNSTEEYGKEEREMKSKKREERVVPNSFYL